MNNDLYTGSTNLTPYVFAGGVGSASIGMSDQIRVIPRQISTGTLQGTQNVGFGNVQINGSTNSINIAGSSGSQAISIGPLTSTSIQSGVAATSVGTSANGFGFSVTDASGNTINIGTLPDGNFGFSITDPSGFLLFELNAATWFWYDKIHNVNVMQIGELPDGTYGEAVAKPGLNVSSIYA